MVGLKYHAFEYAYARPSLRIRNSSNINVHLTLSSIGIIFKSFKRLYMTLDEDGSVLRWWKNDQRTSSDGALFMKLVSHIIMF